MRAPTPAPLLLVHLLLAPLTLATPPPHPRPASPLLPLFLFPTDAPLQPHPSPMSPSFPRPPFRASSLPNLRNPNPNLARLFHPPNLPALRSKTSDVFPNSISLFQITCPGYFYVHSCTQRCSCEDDRRLKCPPGVEVCLATCWCMPWMVPVGGPVGVGGLGGDRAAGALSREGLVGAGLGSPGRTEGSRVGGEGGNRGGGSSGGGGGGVSGLGVKGGVSKATQGTTDEQAGGRAHNTRSSRKEGLWKGLS